MESATTTMRYDFSFPPKAPSSNSSSVHNRAHQNHFHPSSSSSSSSSTFSGSSVFSKLFPNSLLSCAPPTTQNGPNQNSNYRSRAPNNCCLGPRPSDQPMNRHHNLSGNNNNNNQYGNTVRSRIQYGNGGNTGGQSQQHHHHHHSNNHIHNHHQHQHQHHQSLMASSGQQSSSGGIGAPGTPKDGNCSFTFDDLKNTLSFMDDSPLVAQNSSQNPNGSAAPTKQLMVNLPVPSTTANGEQHFSLHSGGSSTSTASSAYSSASANANGSAGGGGGCVPKSMSNPMLLSTCSSASSLSGVSTSPVSLSSTNSGGDADDKRPPGMHRHSDHQSNANQNNYHHNHNNHHHHHSNYHHNSPSSLALPLPLPTPSHCNNNTNNNNNENSPLVNRIAMNNNNNTTSSIETAAKKYRFAAQNSEATCCWKGKLPPKQYKPPIVYSSKVFVGGLPWDISETDMFKEFGVYGPCRIEWTHKDRYSMIQSQQEASFPEQGYRRSMPNMKQNNTLSSMPSLSSQSLASNGSQSGAGDGSNNGGNGSKQRTSPGFAYVIYDSEYSVRALVSNCIEDYQNGRDRVEYFFKISTRRVRNKEVQIIPWILADNNFATCTPKDLDPKKTVFVGNLHGTMTARDLAHIMNELFGSVVYAGIDIDKLKYPIGSGRVTFAHQQNFMRAVRAAFVDIQSLKFSKRIQIDPYLEDVQCCLCANDKGIYFCRDFQCFNYYCGGCWEKQHSFNHQMGNHKPLMRKREEK